MQSAVSRRALLSRGAAAAVAAVASGPAPAGWGGRADTVLYNGKILTMADEAAEVEALALIGDRILAIGSSADMLALAPAGARRIDLGGQRVTPGFNDAHAHPGDAGVQLLTQIPLEMDSIDAVLTTLRQHAAAAPPGSWLIGCFYDDGKTARPLERADLDQAVPDHPVLVQHRGGHTVFANSLALALAGIDEHNADLHFFRGEDGRLDGRAAEAGADRLLALTRLNPGRDDYRRGAALIARQLASVGITSVCDADGSTLMLQGYQDARDAGELDVRVYCHIDAGEVGKLMAAGLHSGFGDDRLRLGGVKLIADGSISERTALLSEPYLGLGDYRGISNDSAEALYAKARAPYLGGWQIGTHANGDVAIDRILSVYERLQHEAPRADARLRIEHCTLINPSLLARIKALGALPVPFAGYVTFHGEKLHFYGEQRLRQMFAMRDFLDAGIKAPSSSDYSASPALPVLWLHAQVTRQDRQGKVWGGNQRISMREAILCGTLHGAYASFEERIKGRLAPGMLADLVVWQQDLLSVEAAQVMTVRPERTMLAGRWVYQS